MYFIKIIQMQRKSIKKNLRNHLIFFNANLKFNLIIDRHSEHFKSWRAQIRL